jgi:hypothetical protein
MTKRGIAGDRPCHSTPDIRDVSIMVRGGAKLLRARQEPDQLPRIVNEHGKMLWTDAERVAAIFE